MAIAQAGRAAAVTINLVEVNISIGAHIALAVVLDRQAHGVAHLLVVRPALTELA